MPRFTLPRRAATPAATVPQPQPEVAPANPEPPTQEIPMQKGFIQFGGAGRSKAVRVDAIESYELQRGETLVIDLRGHQRVTHRGITAFDELHDALLRAGAAIPPHLRQVHPGFRIAGPYQDQMGVRLDAIDGYEAKGSQVVLHMRSGLDKQFPIAHLDDLRDALEAVYGPEIALTKTRHEEPIAVGNFASESPYDHFAHRIPHHR